LDTSKNKLAPGIVVSVLIENRPHVCELLERAAGPGEWNATELVYKTMDGAGGFKKLGKVKIFEEQVVQVFGEMADGKP
jgi:hypothetical protein